MIYIGCLFLTLGVFIMLYMHQRRYWFYLFTENEKRHLVMGMMSNRKTLDLDVECTAMRKDLDSILRA